MSHRPSWPAPEREVWQLVEDIFGCGKSIALAVTGAGSRALSWLLNHPGASSTIVEARVPYAPSALDAFLQQQGPHRCDGETARRMALQSFRFALETEAAPPTILGVGCTAALKTDRERRGADRAHVAIRSAHSYRIFCIEFDRQSSDRLSQEEALSCTILTAIGRACDLNRAVLALPEWASSGEGKKWPVDGGVEKLLSDQAEVVEFRGGKESHSEVARDHRVLLSGSFNPLHEGHKGLIETVAGIAGGTATFELSVTNVDKPSLLYSEILCRARSVAGAIPLVLTRASTFAEKARLVPGAHFAIGYDTGLRLVDPKYYGGKEARDAALAQLKALDCRFYVAGRLWKGEFRSIEDVDLPGVARELVVAIPESEFRVDLSSTTIREQRGSA
ncbi:MAG: hypothetical protein VX733_11760 [Candidatus Latescibacterota bacterium]|nr:hypothetical protein [Candidatus Latescibacterota bacterium]